MIIADSVFVNGVVVTVDKKDSICQAIAVRNGRIIDVGKTADIKKYMGSQTRVVDLMGKMILPAAYDGHCHCTAMGGNTLMVNFSYPEIDTAEKMRNRIKEAVTKL